MRPFGPDPHKVGSGLLRGSGWLTTGTTGEQVPVVLSPSGCLAMYPVLHEERAGLANSFGQHCSLRSDGGQRTSKISADTAFKGMLTRTKTTVETKRS